MNAKITRRVLLKRTFGTIIGSLGLSSGGYIYARHVEPNMLKVTNKFIQHIHIPVNFNNVTIIQFSDTHLGFQYNLEKLHDLVTKINDLNPNLIFFTGDLIDEPSTFTSVNETIQLLSKLTAPLGKYAIYGNHDHGGYGTKLYKQIMVNAGFDLLKNEAKQIRLADGNEIYVLGIDDAMLGEPNIQATLKNVPVDAYKILLSHAPDVADEAYSYGINLQLSGHSHGGQIKIPFLGALVKPPFAEKYFEGFYTIGDEAPLTLYVNRGLGTTRLPFRFLSSPELTVFTLSNED